MIPLAILLSGLIYTTLGDVRVSLDSNELDGTWKLQNDNGSIITNGRVPGGVFTDLQDGKILNESILYRQNDHEYKWVSRENWTYSRNFDLPAEIVQKKLVNLVLHGVDTVAEVSLNGQLLGSVDNMFVRYVFPINNIVQELNNTLEVRVLSAVDSAAARSAALPKPVLPDCVPDAYQGECHANMLRKMQASFSWDWGPAFPGAGLWKSVEVEGLDVGVIRDLTTFASKVEVDGLTNWLLNVTIYAELAVEKFEGIAIGILTSDQKHVISQKSSLYNVIINENNTYVATKEFYFDEVSCGDWNEIDKWWPAGFGEQNLYSLEISLITSSGAKEDVSKTVRIGFRTLELVQDRLNEKLEGLSFYFRVNDVPIFMKGANWIPAHVLPELGYDPAIVRNLLTSAKAANMNMLRVWGGGVYESDLFYQLADEMGILIWQDFMFASSMYPVDEASLVSAATETEQQVRRLQHHASIAVWSGNNENEGALVSGYFGTAPEFERYKAEYLKLYIETMMPIVNANDPSRVYLGSSPSNGDHEVEEGYMSSDVGNPLYGDLHYYNYGSNGWLSSTYPDTRFASEYGFQSFSTLTGLKSVSVPDDWLIASEFSQMRQHHPNGFTEMEKMIRQHFPMTQNSSSVEHFQQFVYYSQINQAMSTKTETEKYRRDRSKLTADNKGQTMGALYWQLNDVWHAPTWSSIEFGGRWKMLHYFAKKFFAPVLVSPEITSDGSLNVYLVSDLLEDVPSVDVEILLMSFSTLDPLLKLSTTVTMTRATSELVFKSNAATLLNNPECAPNSCFLYFTLRQDGQLLSDNVYYPNSFVDVPLSNANLTVTLLDFTMDTATLDIYADGVAPFVWLETSLEGVFSDNGFALVNNHTQITFESWAGDFDRATFVGALTVQDLTFVTPRQAIDISGEYF